MHMYTKYEVSMCNPVPGGTAQMPMPMMMDKARLYKAP